MIIIRHIILFFSACIFAVLMSGCNSKPVSTFSEGIVEYEVEAIDKANPLAALLPSNATMLFKEQQFVIEMSTMGAFITKFFGNAHDKTLTQTLKFWDIKDACVETAQQLKKENDSYLLAFKKTNETKMIAGYKCKKLVATMVNDPKTFFDVFYTEEIAADSINLIGPYSKINGMLMEYRLKKIGLEIQFKAKSIKSTKVNDSEFEIPSYFKIVTREDMNKHFASF